MTVAYVKLPERSDVRPTRAVALLLSSQQGLSVKISGYRQFDLAKIPIERVVAEVSDCGYKWPAPTFGKMKSALSIGLEEPVSTIVFVLDPSLSAEFSTSFPPFFTSNEDDARFLCNPVLWPSSGTMSETATIASVTALMDGKPRTVDFNMAVDNVGVVGDNDEPYRTPIIIDPDLRYPPPGGAGGGPP